MRSIFRIIGLAIALLAGFSAPRVAWADEPLEATDTAHYRIEYGPGLAPAARTLAHRVEEWHARIYAELGADPADHTDIAIMGDERDMFDLVAQRQSGSRPPEWASGLAFPGSRTIYLRANIPADELATTAQHEISHIAMGEAAGPGRVPVWFTEGVSIRQSEPLAVDRIWLLTEAALADRLLPLDQLTRGFPANGNRAGVAYAQSVHFIGFLFSHYGADRFRGLMNGLRESARANPPVPFQAVVADVYGQPLGMIEAQWRESLNFWWGWIPIVFAGASFWVLAGLLLYGAFRKRRREQARRMHDLAGLEAVDMAEDVEISHNLRPPPKMHDPYDGRPPSIH